MINKSQKGISIIEVIGSLVIVALMSMLIMSFYAKQAHKTNVKRTEFLLQDIRDKIKTIYIDGDYHLLSLDNLNSELEGREQIENSHPLGGGSIRLCGTTEGFNIILEGLSDEDGIRLQEMGEGSFSTDTKELIAFKSNRDSSDRDETGYCN